VIGPEKSRHCQTWLKCLLVEWKLTTKPELNCEIYKCKRKCWKNQLSFCHQSSLVGWKAWIFPWILLELKEYARKTAVAVITGHHLIRVLNERRVTDGGNLCPLWLVILKLVCHGIGDTLWLQYSWPRAVASCTFLAVVPWNGLEHSRRKVRLRVYSNWI